MSYSVHFRPEVETDITEAAEWYEKQSKKLGVQFLDEVLSICENISENPEMYPVIHRGSRRAIIHKFPFGVYYRIEGEIIIVFAIMHGSRHPKRWQKRT